MISHESGGMDLKFGIKLLMIASVLALISIDKCFDKVEAAGGSNILTCFGQRQVPRSNYSLWSEVFEVIDKHLSTKIQSRDLNRNLEEVEDLLTAEKGARTTTKIICGSTSSSSEVCISQRLRSKDKNIAKNALSKLLNLESHQDCLVATTNNLAELNEMAMNPIGRCARGQSNILPRIDHMVFNAALQRAKTCLPRYREQLLRIGSLSDKRTSAIKIFWDQILEHRLKTLNEDLDKVFEQHPIEAIEAIKRMPNAIEWDEMYTAQANLKYGVANSSTEPSVEGSISKVSFNYEKSVKVPCTNFMHMVSGIFESLNFDLQLRSFVPHESIEQSDLDSVINRQRAYYLMCEKALQQEQRFNDIMWDLGGSRRFE